VVSVAGQDRFQAEVTHPVINEVVDVAEALPSMEAQRHERHVARINIEAETAKTRAAIPLARETKAMQMYIAPGEDDLQRGMEGTRDRSLRTRSRRQISGLMPCTTTRN
jgi:hypothetical protein